MSTAEAEQGNPDIGAGPWTPHFVTSRGHHCCRNVARSQTPSCHAGQHLRDTRIYHPSANATSLPGNCVR